MSGARAASFVRPLVAACLLAGLAATSAPAQQVFDGDPTDPGSGVPWIVMPGLPLLLPGDDGKFGTGDDGIDTGIEGDVDVVVRSGSISSSAIPAPALAPGGAAIATVEAGGGHTGLGAEAPFTVMVSDGSGSPPYGDVITAADMDLRPITVYAFADLDGDGVIGPTSADGSGDNALELQEATAYAGRQMGAFDAGRFTDSLGLEIAAPASLGGLSVGLVAAGWTGTDPQELFSDGPLVLTRWPFVPPFDPKDVLGGGHPPDPDPALSNELEWDIERNYLPAPGHPVLGTPFALPVDGSEPTTDQVRVVSSDAVSARVFVEPSAADFLARSRPRLRVAPATGSSGRVLVLAAERLVLAADGAASTLAVRVLPTDFFANVADPASPVSVTVSVTGAASIVSPDTDSNSKSETLSLADAEGSVLVLDDDGAGSAKLQLSIGGAPVESVDLAVGVAADSDGDGVADDGSASGTGGDRPCDTATAGCDDNCAGVVNPSQLDSNHDGLGDCCDGTCIHIPTGPTCGECQLPVTPDFGTFSDGRLSVRLGDGVDADKVTIRLSFPLSLSATVAPDSETVSLVLTQTGSGGYSATLASLFTDLQKSSPSFRYADRSGSVDGVLKSQIKGRADGRWKMVLRARGVSIASLASGAASLTLTLGDDVVSGSFDCQGSVPHLSCELVP